MARALILAFCLAAYPAFGFLEKFIEKHMEEQSAEWKRETIETLAKGEDPKERAKAAKGLSGRKDPESIAALAGALSDPDAKVRQAAASGLWRIEKAAEPARPQLMKALDDPDPDVVSRVAGALQALGMKADELAPARKRVFASPEATLDSRFLVSRNLVGHEPPVRLAEVMIAYLDHVARGYTGSVSDKNRHNVELAEKALERLVKRTKDRALIPPLVEALDNAKGSAIILMKTLAWFEPKPEGFTQVLLARLDSPQPRVRHAALTHLRGMKGEKDVAMWMPRAAAMLQDADSSVRSEALWALGSAAGLASGEIDKVAAALGDPDKYVRRSAARAIGEIGEPRQAIPAADKARVAAAGRPALTAAMEKDADPDVRSEAKSALAKLRRGTSVASAPLSAPASTPSESSGMSVLRARKVTFEPSSYFRALSEGDVELVRAFLDAGMSPKNSLMDMGPPMRVMLFAGKACNPNVRPTKAQTKEIVRMLLERGADINGADKNGNTALMEAAGKGCDRELIRTMIKAGAKIHATNGSGLTPFEMGLWMGHDGLEELIAAGYRLPPAKVKGYLEGYKDRPAAQAMVKKAARK
jgi:HEAT repeat protein